MFASPQQRMGPPSALLASSWTPLSLRQSGSCQIGSTVPLKRARICRCAALEITSNAPSAEEGNKSPAQQCTYGGHNILWLASELQRLLTIQVLTIRRNLFIGRGLQDVAPCVDSNVRA